MHDRNQPKKKQNTSISNRLLIENRLGEFYLKSLLFRFLFSLIYNDIKLVMCIIIIEIMKKKI